MGFFDKIRNLQAKTDPLNAGLENLVFGPPSTGNGNFSGVPNGQNFGLAPPPPPDPLSTLIQPTLMPSQNSPLLGQVKRQSVRRQLARSGRMSTILTQPDDSLGA
jgi:hypothetical protein